MRNTGGPGGRGRRAWGDSSWENDGVPEEEGAEQDGAPHQDGGGEDGRHEGGRHEDDGSLRDGQPAEEDWDDDAELSQLVRPYTLTRGRTRHAEGAAFDVIAQVVAADRDGLADPDGAEGADDPEHQQILELVRSAPLSVAEIAAETDLPLGVARILLGDLLDAELIRVSRPVPAALLPDVSVLREVIQGLRAL
ncbi:DUF742 domain-containing protein [Streptacidiphilus sp. N1-10]|uniref:DUF742 domain-containing protein n=1 Tax=Streptacidiphilus jeojiensis TaxID=3229225 RepID=A0ABV6XYA3_9ACTN